MMILHPLYDMLQFESISFTFLFELAQISTLGKSVPEILTQAKQSTSDTSDTEILEAQIAVLQHGELYSLLSSFIENLQTIINNKIAFAR